MVDDYHGKVVVTVMATHGKVVVTVIILTMVCIYPPIVVVISSIIGAGESFLAMTTALNGKVGVCHDLHQRQSAGKVTMMAKANTPTPMVVVAVVAVRA